jgi:hypothetical protein
MSSSEADVAGRMTEGKPRDSNHMAHRSSLLLTKESKRDQHSDDPLVYVSTTGLHSIPYPLRVSSL